MFLFASQKAAVTTSVFSLHLVCLFAFTLPSSFSFACRRVPSVSPPSLSSAALPWEQAATLAAAVEDVEKRLSKDVEEARAKEEEVKVSSGGRKETRCGHDPAVAAQLESCKCPESSAGRMCSEQLTPCPFRFASVAHPFWTHPPEFA